MFAELEEEVVFEKPPAAARKDRGLRDLVIAEELGHLVNSRVKAQHEEAPLAHRQRHQVMLDSANPWTGAPP